MSGFFSRAAKFIRREITDKPYYQFLLYLEDEVLYEAKHDQPTCRLEIPDWLFLKYYDRLKAAKIVYGRWALFGKTGELNLYPQVLQEVLSTYR